MVSLAGACICAVFAALPEPGTTVTLPVIPQPRESRAVGEGFTPAAGWIIHVTSTPSDRFAATLLRDSLRDSLGLDCVLAPSAWTEGQPHTLFLSAGGGAPEAGPAPALPDEGQAEGYELGTSPAGARVAAPTEAGLYYGTQTLVQLVEQAARDRAPVPGLTVRDWPAFGWRGRYIEGGQERASVVCTRENLERELALLGRYKLNCLIFEVYNLAPFASFPYCACPDTLSRSDWEALVALGRRHHVTIVPSLQSFAQVYEVIWMCDEGAPYREATAPGLICPSRPENIEFLRGLYKDLMELFPDAPFLGIGCSEVDMQWQKRYCPLCQKRLDSGETLRDIYLTHVVNCVHAVEQAAEAVGRPVRPMMWGDEFYAGYGGKRWEGIERIPKNVLIGHWQYWSHYQNMPDHTRTDYDGIEGLLERGYDTLFLSASFEFNTYFHDLSPDEPREDKWNILLDAGIYNIADQAAWAWRHGHQGLPGRVVGGGCATFSQHDIRCWDTTWYAYVLQGEYSWGDPERKLSEVKEPFTDAFTASFYGARDREAAATLADAYRRLDAAKSDLERNNYAIRDIIGEIDIHNEAYVNNTLEQAAGLVDKLLAGDTSKGAEADVRRRAEAARETARSVRDALAGLYPRVRNTYSLGWLLSAAHRIENHATRTVYLLDQQQALAAVAAARPEDRAGLTEQLAALETRLAELRADTRVLTDEADSLTWRPGGDGTGYRAVSKSLEGFAVKLAEVRAALESSR